jgi:hypothetical protein
MGVTIPTWHVCIVAIPPEAGIPLPYPLNRVRIPPRGSGVVGRNTDMRCLHCRYSRLLIVKR